MVGLSQGSLHSSLIIKGKLGVRHQLQQFGVSVTEEINILYTLNTLFANIIRDAITKCRSCRLHGSRIPEVTLQGLTTSKA